MTCCERLIHSFHWISRCGSYGGRTISIRVLTRSGGSYVYRVATPHARQPLQNRFVWQLIGQSLDIRRMNAAAEFCLGTRDFAAFGAPPQAGSKNTVRRVYRSRWEMEVGEFGTTYRYRIRGSAFLYHMVRRLVGMMTQVGRGVISPIEFGAILRSREIGLAKVLAPAHGLILEAVGYPRRQAAESSACAAAAKLSAALEGRT